MHSKIGMHINHDRYQSADDNLLQKAACSGQHEPFYILITNSVYFWNVKLGTFNFVCILVN